MGFRVAAVLMISMVRVGSVGFAQQTVGAASPVAQRDVAVDAASQWIGRALFLRCFCAENSLEFDAQGHVQGVVKKVDWTVAGVNLQKVSRKGPGEIELDGVRVAVRYATDRHEFDRHPQNDDKMRILLADTGDAAGVERALKAVFAVGIDRELQLSLPDYWQHYFNPTTVWPKDSLEGVPIEMKVTPSTTASVAQVTHKTEAGYTAYASRDRVTGTVTLHLVIDAEGMPRRISIMQPLGYGLDEKAVEAAAKYRFTAAMVQGKAVASAAAMNEEFVVVQTPH
jgi:TonB family protein